MSRSIHLELRDSLHCDPTSSGPVDELSGPQLRLDVFLRDCKTISLADRTLPKTAFGTRCPFTMSQVPYVPWTIRRPFTRPLDVRSLLTTGQVLAASFQSHHTPLVIYRPHHRLPATPVGELYPRICTGQHVLHIGHHRLPDNRHGILFKSLQGQGQWVLHPDEEQEEVRDREWGGACPSSETPLG